MPTYEYSCVECGKFEVFQKISDRPLETCPNCGTKVVRVIHGGTGIIFKGSGFYTTDYGSKRSQSASKEEKKEDSANKDSKAS